MAINLLQDHQQSDLIFVISDRTPLNKTHLFKSLKKTLIETI